MARRFESGQAATEMILMIPLLVILSASAIGVTYMCYEGIKVQSAANYAARIQGEERVAGGNTFTSIDDVNGTRGDYDENPLTKDPSERGNDKSNPGDNWAGVYGNYRKQVRQMFGHGELEHLFVPRPQIGNEVDQVKVIRIMQPPKVFGYQPPPVTVQGTAYGGEDTSMYALPRFGSYTPSANTGGAAGGVYWQRSDVLSKGKDSNPTDVLGNN